MTNEDEEMGVFTVIHDDGTEQKLTKKEQDSFLASVQATANALTERDGREAWASACRELNRTVPGLEMDELGGYVPIQGYGKYEGEDCYFRARYQMASFSVGTYDEDGNVTSWMAKRQAQAQVTDDDDPFGAGYLEPAQCVVIIRDLLIPNLRSKTKEEGEAEIKAFTDVVDAMVKQMKEKDEAGKHEEPEKAAPADEQEEAP